MAKIKKENRNWAMATHLSALIGLIGIPLGNIIGPLVVWLLKREEHKFIDRSGKESLNFQISMTIYGLVAFATVLIGIGIILLPIILIANFVLVIIASIKTSDGEKYPLTIRFIK